MEAIAMNAVLATARSLGIDQNSQAVKEAVTTAVLAVREGRSLDLSIDLGNGVLVRAAQALVAA